MIRYSQKVEYPVKDQLGNLVKKDKVDKVNAKTYGYLKKKPSGEKNREWYTEPIFGQKPQVSKEVSFKTYVQFVAQTMQISTG